MSKPHKLQTAKPRPVALEPPFPLYANPSRPTFEEGWNSVVDLLRSKKKIVVLLGAGISVSCGIPDFRTAGSGLYSVLDAEELGLTCPEELFDVHFFLENPVPFYQFARHLYFPQPTKGGPPQKIRPSDAHRLLALLEQKKKLLRVYSQNIDGLEEEAGVSAKKICYCHGTLQWATCCTCKKKVHAQTIEANILSGTVPRCQKMKADHLLPQQPPPAVTRKRSRGAPVLPSAPSPLPPTNLCGGVMKPAVTFFGEALHNNVKTKLEADRDKVDALIVIGTSLSVAPISKVIEYLPPNIPRILINRNIVHPPETLASDDDSDGEEDFRRDYVFDAYLLGFCDDVTRALGRKMFSPDDRSDRASEQGQLLADVLNGDDQDDDATFAAEDWEKIHVPPDRVFLFPGAKPPAAAESGDVSYREIAHCDGCAARIRGKIHKCSTCFDYDLCQKCFPVLSRTHFDGDHHFTVESPFKVK